METQQIVVDRDEARALYRKYREHQHYSEPIDWEIQRAYQAIAQGRMVINARQSIIAAGLGEDQLPKLAIARADAKTCLWVPAHPSYTGGEFRSDDNQREGTRRHHSRFMRIPDQTWPPAPQLRNRRYQYEAQVPLIPIHLRPKRALENYHILFEAEWRRVPPRDPLLLRRIGESELWIVCAAWDLTEVERAALAGRLNA